MTRCGRRIRPRIPRGPPRLPGLVEGAVRTEATRGLIRDDFPRLRRHVSLGTDADPVGDFFGCADHLELELFVRPGMTPAEAIVPPTTRAPRAFGLIRTAAIEAGRVAASSCWMPTRSPTSGVRGRSPQCIFVASR